MRLRPRPHGNVLLLSVVSVAILMVLVAGAIRFTGENREAAVSKLSGNRVHSCADVARQYLLGKLRVSGLNITDLQLDQTLPSTDPDRSARLLTAHYTEPDAGGAAPEPTIAVLKAENISAARQQIRGMESVAPASAMLGGQYYRVVVKCQEGPRESELEFVFRYGL